MRAYAQLIREARQALKLSQQELAEKLGVSRNTVAGWETGHSRPDLDMVPALCKALRVSLASFFGVKSGVSAQDRALLEMFRQLEPQDREVISWEMEALLERRRQKLESEARDNIIPLYYSDLGVAAGFGGTLGEAQGEQILLVKDDRTSRADEVIRVSGRSMEPTFYDGDRVLLQHTDELRPGEIGVFLVEGEGYIKEFRKDGLYSHNPDYSPMRFSEWQDVRCVGRVIGKLTEDEIPSEKAVRYYEEAVRGGK